MPDSIYLDHNATTPVFPEVIEAMRACWAEPYLNPASQHSFGRAARRVLEDARDCIGELLGAASHDRVIFTSGGTEANNMAIRGLRQRPISSRGIARRPQNHIIVSSIEHPSITSIADEIAEFVHKIRGARRAISVSRLAVDTNCVISLIDLARCINPTIRVAAVMLANNETGVIQPIADLAAICFQHEVPLHVDAAQAAGKLPIDFGQLGIATMSVAAHKFGGPLGIGALIVRDGIELAPQLTGGFQQAGTRPGTESVALAVGMRTALDSWQGRRDEWSAHIALLRDQFETTLCHVGALTTCRPVIIGKASPRLPTTSNIAFVGLDRQQLFLALDQAGVACSTGSACASGSSEPSPTHIAMGCEPAVISSALRFSFGVTTTAAEVEEAASRILKVCNGLGR